ncbi:hypothetical protein [Halomonas sp. HL-93]|uniref:hypothetical protein n=1 Tax=Halomonas sp. HL-93 TaxID=1666906 RepID=UPI0006DAF1A6|nr:MAG: TonB-dependent Receptor Plug Domain [Halomonas sp. HL-93]
MLRNPIPFARVPLAAAVRRSLTLSLGGMLCIAPLAVLAQEEDNVDNGTTVVTATALKVDTPSVETPRPVSTVNREELDDRNVQQLDETFRYRSGVLSGHYGVR